MSSAAAEEERATAEEEPAVVMEEPAVVMEASGVHSMPKSRQPGARTAHNKNNWQDEGSKISGLANSGNADAEATMEKRNYTKYKSRTKDNPKKTFDQWKKERKETARKKACLLAAAPATPNSAPAAAPAAAAAVFTPNLQSANAGLPSLPFAGASPPPLIGPAGSGGVLCGSFAGSGLGLGLGLGPGPRPGPSLHSCAGPGPGPGTASAYTAPVLPCLASTGVVYAGSTISRHSAGTSGPGWIPIAGTARLRREVFPLD